MSREDQRAVAHEPAAALLSSGESSGLLHSTHAHRPDGGTRLHVTQAPSGIDQSSGRGEAGKSDGTPTLLRQAFWVLLYTQTMSTDTIPLQIRVTKGKLNRTFAKWISDPWIRVIRMAAGSSTIVQKLFERCSRAASEHARTPSRSRADRARLQQCNSG